MRKKKKNLMLEIANKKYINAFSSYSAKTKHDGLTDGRGALQYLPSRAFGAAGNKKSLPE